MDDGGSPAIGLVVFLILTVLARGGYRQALWLLKVKDSPYKTRHAIQVLLTFVSGVFGIHQIRLLAKILAEIFGGDGSEAYLKIICYVLAAVLGVFLFAVLGIIAPQKVAARKQINGCLL